MYQFPYRPRPPQSCGECAFLPDCGGLDGPAYAHGCFRRCVEKCQFAGCDMACPCLHLTFPDRLEEAGGLWAPPERKLVPFVNCNTLPLYIAQIDHGSCRDTPLDVPAVVIPLSAIVGRRRNGKYDVRFSSPEALRERLRIGKDCEIIVSSIAPDQVIEDFWESHVSRSILPKIANLQLRGMTVPNYSFMLDVPRINSIYNVSRMFRVAERMSEAGIPTILHIQASTRYDWARWKDVLREEVGCSTIAAEFETGPSTKPIGNAYFAGLADLQQGVGRPLHLIAVAGAGRLREMRTTFNSLTIVDSTPFLKTVHRQKLIRIALLKWKWRPNLTKPGETLSDLLRWNVDAQAERIREIAFSSADLLRQHLSRLQSPNNQKKEPQPIGPAPHMTSLPSSPLPAGSPQATVQ